MWWCWRRWWWRRRQRLGLNICPHRFHVHVHTHVHTTTHPTLCRNNYHCSSKCNSFSHAMFTHRPISPLTFLVCCVFVCVIYSPSINRSFPGLISFALSQAYWLSTAYASRYLILIEAHPLLFTQNNNIFSPVAHTTTYSPLHLPHHLVLSMFSLSVHMSSWELVKFH